MMSVGARVDDWDTVERGILCEIEKRSEYHIVDVLYSEKSGGGTTMEMQCRVHKPMPTVSITKPLVHSNMTVIDGMARFLRGLSRSSRKSIWAHAVRPKPQNEGNALNLMNRFHGNQRVNVLDSTTGIGQIEQLLCDLLMLYTKVCTL